MNGFSARRMALISLGGLGLALASCSPSGGGGVADAVLLLSGEPGATSDLPADLRCAGVAVEQGSRVLEVLGERVYAWSCLDSRAGRVETMWFDDAGAPVDLKALKAEAVRVYREVRHRMDGTIRQRFAKHASGTRLAADVWLAIDLDPLPPRDELALSRTVRDTAYGRRFGAYRSAVARLTAAVRAIAPAATVEYNDEPGRSVPAPFVTITATEAELERIGDLDQVLRITTSSAEDAALAEPHSESYYQLDGIPTLHAGGWNGDGVTVAVQEGSRFDAGVVNLGAAIGSCSEGGTSYRCRCPSGAEGDHPRQVAGIIRNTVTPGRGTARGVTLISANHDESVGCDLEEALEWSVTQVAQVISRSAPAGDHDDETRQTSIDLILDYYAMQYPFPFISVSAGNSGTATYTSNRLHNGLVVGAAQNTSDTSRANLKAMRSSSAAKNYHGDTGWELPHIVAPGNYIDTAGYSAGAVSTLSATSAAQPQVAGVAAALLERSDWLDLWPEATMAILLAATEQNVAGRWPLDLNDTGPGSDDADGVGAVHGAYALTIASNKRDGGDPAAAAGFDRGLISDATLPEDTFYSEVYSATVPAGATLRVALVGAAEVACTSALDRGSCTLAPYAELELWLFRGSTMVGQSINGENNYQYEYWKNTSTTSKTVTIKFQVDEYNGLSDSGVSFGLAWGTGG